MSEQVRRATIDDLPQLIELWKVERLPWETFERRLTEFQIAVNDAGRVLGAVGLQIVAKQGWLYGEAFRTGDRSDDLRELLWKRMESLANNHGLLRVWTLETAPFWRATAFASAPEEMRGKLPAEFGEKENDWLMVQLRPEPPTGVFSAEAELAVFREAERAQTQAIFQQARVMKMVATILALILFICVAVMAFYLMRRLKNPH